MSDKILKQVSSTCNINYSFETQYKMGKLNRKVRVKKRKPVKAYFTFLLSQR